MTVTVNTITDYKNKAPPALTIGADSILLDINTPQAGHYFVAGEIDTSALDSVAPDILVVKEYHGIDEANLRLYFSWTYTGTQAYPVLAFLGKQCFPNELYRIVIKQTAGTGRVIPYWFALQVLNF